MRRYPLLPLPCALRHRKSRIQISTEQEIGASVLAAFCPQRNFRGIRVPRGTVPSTVSVAIEYPSQPLAICSWQQHSVANYSFNAVLKPHNPHASIVAHRVNRDAKIPVIEREIPGAGNAY